MLYFVSPKRSATHSAIFWTLSFMFTFIFTVDLDCSVRITLASIWTFVDQTMSLSSGCNSSTDSSPSTMQDQRPSSTLCFTYTTLFSASNMRAWPEMMKYKYRSSFGLLQLLQHLNHALRLTLHQVGVRLNILGNFLHFFNLTRCLMHHSMDFERVYRQQRHSIGKDVHVVLVVNLRLLHQLSLNGQCLLRVNTRHNSSLLIFILINYRSVQSFLNLCRFILLLCCV